MDKIILEKIGAEGLPYHMVEKYKEVRRKQEQDPMPALQVPDLEVWKQELVKKFRAEGETVCRNIVYSASKSIENCWNHSDLMEKVIFYAEREVGKLLGPFLMEQYISTMAKEMDGLARSRGLKEWGDRFADVDGHINYWQSKIPPPFSADKINVDERYPHERIGEIDGRYWDKWLSTVLKSKPVFFDAPNYKAKLLEAYQIYFDECEKEEAAKRASQSPPVQPSPPPVETNVASSNSEKTDWRDFWEEREGLQDILSSRKRGIYRSEQ